jgi:serine/threonine protein kinase
MTRPLGSSYTLHESLGRGSTGEVLRGTDAEGREYAVKVLSPGLASDPTVVAKFVQERAILTSLDHEGLVRVHDLVAEGHTVAIVMDLVEGGDLRGRIQQDGPVPPADIARIGAAVAEALAVVHANGIAHGDVKPENILMDARTDPRAPRLTDFGIARIAESSQRTRSTMLVGTPEYVAPEIIDGSPATASSDLYALGIVLYELTCGATPFVGGSTMAVLRRHLELEPGRPDGVPDALWDFILWCLAKSPGDRVPSARHAATALHGLHPMLVGAPPAPAVDGPPAAMSPAPTPSGTPPAPQPAEAAGVSTHVVGRPKSRRRLALVGGALLLLVLSGTGAAIAVMGKDDAKTTESAAATSDGDGKASASNSPTPPSQTSDPTPTVSPSGPYVMPMLVGQSETSARASLPDGIKVTTTDVLDESVPDGEVLEQSPAEGSEVTDAVSLTVARQPVIVYLDQLEVAAIDAYSGVSESGTAAISGDKFTHSQTYEVTCDWGSEWVEYTLGRDYRLLRFTAGMDDQSRDSSAQMQLEVFIDGQLITTEKVAYGEQVEVEVDVTDALRLRIGWSELQLDLCEGDYLVLAQARLLGMPGEVELPEGDTDW